MLRKPAGGKLLSSRGDAYHDLSAAETRAESAGFAFERLAGAPTVFNLVRDATGTIKMSDRPRHAGMVIGRALSLTMAVPPAVPPAVPRMLRMPRMPRMPPVPPVPHTPRISHYTRRHVVAPEPSARASLDEGDVAEKSSTWDSDDALPDDFCVHWDTHLHATSSGTLAATVERLCPFAAAVRELLLPAHGQQGQAPQAEQQLLSLLSRCEQQLGSDLSQLRRPAPAVWTVVGAVATCAAAACCESELPSPLHEGAEATPVHHRVWSDADAAAMRAGHQAGPVALTTALLGLPRPATCGLAGKATPLGATSYWRILALATEMWRAVVQQTPGSLGLLLLQSCHLPGGHPVVAAIAPQASPSVVAVLSVGDTIVSIDGQRMCYGNAADALTRVRIGPMNVVARRQIDVGESGEDPTEATHQFETQLEALPLSQCLAPQAISPDDAPMLGRLISSAAVQGIFRRKFGADPQQPGDQGRKQWPYCWSLAGHPQALQSLDAVRVSVRDHGVERLALGVLLSHPAASLSQLRVGLREAALHHLHGQQQSQCLGAIVRGSYQFGRRSETDFQSDVVPFSEEATLVALSMVPGLCVQLHQFSSSPPAQQPTSSAPNTVSLHLYLAPAEPQGFQVRVQLSCIVPPAAPAAAANVEQAAPTSSRQHLPGIMPAILELGYGGTVELSATDTHGTCVFGCRQAGCCFLKMETNGRVGAAAIMAMRQCLTGNAVLPRNKRLGHLYDLRERVVYELRMQAALGMLSPRAVTEMKRLAGEPVTMQATACFGLDNFPFSGSSALNIGISFADCCRDDAAHAIFRQFRSPYICMGKVWASEESSFELETVLSHQLRSILTKPIEIGRLRFSATPAHRRLIANSDGKAVNITFGLQGGGVLFRSASHVNSMDEFDAVLRPAGSSEWCRRSVREVDRLAKLGAKWRQDVSVEHGRLYNGAAPQSSDLAMQLSLLFGCIGTKAFDGRRPLFAALLEEQDLDLVSVLKALHDAKNLAKRTYFLLLDMVKTSIQYPTKDAARGAFLDGAKVIMGRTMDEANGRHVDLLMQQLSHAPLMRHLFPPEALSLVRLNHQIGDLVHSDVLSDGEWIVFDASVLALKSLFVKLREKTFTKHPLAELAWHEMLNCSVDMRRNLRMASPGSASDAHLERDNGCTRAEARRGSSHHGDFLFQADAGVLMHEASRASHAARAADTPQKTSQAPRHRPLRVLRVWMDVVHLSSEVHQDFETFLNDVKAHGAEAQYVRIGPPPPSPPQFIDFASVTLDAATATLPDNAHLVEVRAPGAPLETLPAACRLAAHASSFCCRDGTVEQQAAAAAADDAARARAQHVAAVLTAASGLESNGLLRSVADGGNLRLISDTGSLHDAKPTALALGLRVASPVQVLEWATVRDATIFLWSNDDGFTGTVTVKTPGSDGSLSPSVLLSRGEVSGQRQLQLKWAGQGCSSFQLCFAHTDVCVLEVRRAATAADGRPDCCVLLAGKSRSRSHPLSDESVQEVLRLSAKHALPAPRYAGVLGGTSSDSEAARAARNRLLSRQPSAKAQRTHVAFGCFPHARSCLQCHTNAPWGCPADRCATCCRRVHAAGAWSCPAPEHVRAALKRATNGGNGSAPAAKRPKGPSAGGKRKAPDSGVPKAASQAQQRARPDRFQAGAEEWVPGRDDGKARRAKAVPGAAKKAAVGGGEKTPTAAALSISVPARLADLIMEGEVQVYNHANPLKPGWYLLRATSVNLGSDQAQLLAGLPQSETPAAGINRLLGAINVTHTRRPDECGGALFAQGPNCSVIGARARLAEPVVATGRFATWQPASDNQVGKQAFKAAQVALASATIEPNTHSWGAQSDGGEAATKSSRRSSNQVQPLRALTVKQPFASGILHSKKLTEYRSWQLSLQPDGSGRWLVMHAGTGKTGAEHAPHLEALEASWPKDERPAVLPTGILGFFHVSKGAC